MVEEKLEVYRGDTDKMGNTHKTAIEGVSGVFAWGSRSRNRNFKGESSATTADLFVKRGTDLRARDRVRRANGEEYAVVGNSMWDQAFPFDGFDFGYMMFRLEAI